MKPTERLIPSDNADSKRVVGKNLGFIDGPVTALPGDVIYRAQRAVAARAVDGPDAQHLLETLGLIPPSTPRRRRRRGVPA